MKTKTFKKIFGTFAVLTLALGAGVAFRFASAGTGESASGWLWGGSEAIDTNGALTPNNGSIDGDESGLGWISMNDTTVGSGGGAYGVNIPPTGDGPVTGYAWWGHGLLTGSGDWLEFQPAGPYPESPSSGVQRQGDSLVGWGRFVGIRNNVAAGNAGGFDGWVKFSGIAADGSPYGVTVSGTTLSGFAWSSDLGGIDFSKASITAPSVLQVCREGAPISGAGLNFSLAQNAVTTLKVYFDATPGDCVEPSVTTTTWTESGPNAVSLIGTNPKTVKAGAVASLAEQVIVSYDDAGTTHSVTMNIGVTCSVVIPACDTAAAQARCVGQQYNMAYTDNCTGLQATQQCAGTRYCDFNWKEVAPGN